MAKTSFELKTRLIAELTIIPEKWPLTPVLDNKRPYRKGWQTEPPITRRALENLIWNGDRQFSEKSGKFWTARPAGYGLRTGNRYIAIDEDGASAGALLQTLSGGDLPKTVSWTSGKEGRKQSLYRIPEALQQRLDAIEFTHHAITEGCEEGQQLDFRNNNCQSVLPRSLHPETGSYEWIVSPAESPVTDAPQWLIDWLNNHCDDQERIAEEKRKAQAEADHWRLEKQQRKAAGLTLVGETDLFELLDDTIDQLGASAFNDPGHGWKKAAGKYRGNCSFHESASKSSAVIFRHKTSGAWVYHCPTCTKERAGGKGKAIGPLEYFYNLQKGSSNGNLKDLPTKKDFIAVVKDFLREHGVAVPEKPFIDWSRVQEPDPDEYNAHCDRLKEQWQAEQAIARQRKIDKYREETEKHQEWMNRLDQEPTLVVSDRYLPAGELPDEPGIVLVDAPMGRGKTSSYVKGLVEQQAQLYPDGKFIMLGGRNSLQLQTVALYGGKHHTQYQSAAEMLGDRWQVCCFDSIWKLDPSRITPGSILFLDEISQGIDHLVNGNTIKEQRPFVVNRSKELARAVIDRGGWIVASEDGITNVELKLLKDIAGAVPITLVKSEWKTETPWKIDLYDSPSLTWEEILIRLEKGENLIVCSDSAHWLRELERWLIDNHYLNPNEVWVRDGDSTEEPWAKAFDKNPDKWIEHHTPRVLMYSPSLQSGVSITIPHFDAMAIHLVNLQPRVSRQLPARYRLPVPRFGYVKEFAVSPDESCKSFNPDAVLHDLRKTTEGVAKLTEIAAFVSTRQAEQTGEPVDLSGTLSRMLNGDDPDEAFWLEYWAMYKARENYGKAHLREFLIQDWEAAGHIVTYTKYGPNKAIREERKQVRKTLDREESVRFAEAGAAALTVQEARTILDQPGSTKDDRRKARKRLRVEQLPGCDLDNPDFVLKALIQDRGKFLKCAELLWAVQNPELQRQLDRADLYGKIHRQSRRGEFVWRPDLKSKAVQADLIRRSPLMDCLVEEAYSEESEQVQRFAEFAKFHKAEFKRTLRLTIKEDHSGCKILNKVLRKLGYELSDSKIGPRGEQVRWYRISNLNDSDRDAILEALSLRFKQRSQSDSEMYPGDTVSTTCTNKTQLQVVDTTPQLLDPECLQDIREMWWAAGGDPRIEAEIRKMYPPEVLKVALRGIAMTQLELSA